MIKRGRIKVPEQNLSVSKSSTKDMDDSNLSKSWTRVDQKSWEPNQ